ncbi:DUF1430 domain-containing protein [Clostridium paraputrificum]|uniref:DUF1430 domain-containing protein n=1 Tax=Clostridium paraputrificum TaxID=29363 RepID=UPI003D33CD6A
MKKIIYFLLIIISMFSFSILFNNEKLKQDNNMEKAEQYSSNSYNILIPNDIQKYSEDSVYNGIIDVVKKYNGNIFYSKIGPNNKKIKFVYLNDLSYLNNFQIVDGRTLSSDDMNLESFLSSEKTGDKNQIGRISTFDGTGLFEIRTLKSIINSNYLLDGNCTVQLQSSNDINMFIRDLETSLNINGIQKQDKNNMSPKYYYNKWIHPSLYFIVVLLILYSILKSYKKFGIKIMLGYSIKDIWIKEVSSLVISQILIVIVVNVIMSIFLFKEFNIYFIDFSKNLIKSNIIQILILFIISSVPFIYLNNITIINIIKNKIPIKDIITFNSILKVILIILFFNLINQGILNYERINNVFTNKYEAWEEAKDYYIIPYMNNKNEDLPEGEESVKKLSQLYLNLNKDGTIMADFNLYSPGQRERLKNDKKHDYERDWVTVNPNYLNENVVYDINNEPVKISEDDNNLVLLVPDKYKEDEKGIIELWENIKNGYSEGESTKNQKIKILYTKSNQKVFSYSADVNINDGNMVVDPIIRVITEKNGVPSDYYITIGFTGNPIKIKVDPSFDSEKYIYQKLKELGLEKYVDKVVPANDGVVFESKSVYELLAFIIGGIIILTLAMVIIITQNIYCYFEQYKKQLAIRQFHGYKAIDKYKECLLLILVTSLAAFLVNCYMRNLDFAIQIKLTVIFIFIDFLITIIVIKLVNKRKTTSVIKGS